MDSKGQLSAEYILMLGFVLLIVLAVAFYAGNENEQNSISSATRSGATNATTALSVTTPGMLPVRVESIEMSGTGNITLLIKLSNKNAQIADYCCWAIYRKWEKGDLRSHDLIKNKIRSEFDMFAKGNIKYY